MTDDDRKLLDRLRLPTNSWSLWDMAFVLRLLDASEAERDRLRGLLREFATNWDCDTGANGVHHRHCRCCAARNALEAKP